MRGGWEDAMEEARMMANTTNDTTEAPRSAPRHSAAHALYPWQRDDLAKLLAALKAYQRVLYVLPTGAGKTEIGVEVILAVLAEVERGGRVLWLTHRGRLVRQAIDRFLAHGVEAGVIKAGCKANALAQIQIASVKTLANRDEAIEGVVLIVIDEAHGISGSPSSWASPRPVPPNSSRHTSRSTPACRDSA